MPTQPLIVGNPVLVVVDIQQSGGMSVAQEVGILAHAGTCRPGRTGTKAGGSGARSRYTGGVFPGGAPSSAGWTSAVSWTAPRACTASRVSRAPTSEPSLRPLA